RRAALHDCAWLARLLPELLQLVQAPFPAWTLPPEQERRLMFAAVGRLLANVAGPAGTLLVLDDLQWAGADAFELLAGLLHAPAPPPAARTGRLSLHRGGAAVPPRGGPGRPGARRAGHPAHA